MKVVCEKCESSFKYEAVKNMRCCPVCGEPFEMEDGEENEHTDWITWYYYGFKGSSNTLLNDKPIDLEKRGDIYYLIKEFKAPPRDVNGKSDAAKCELRKYVPDAFSENKVSPIRCPRCGSTEYTLMNRGFSVLTGFLGSGKVKRVCNRCKREF